MGPAPVNYARNCGLFHFVEGYFPSGRAERFFFEHTARQGELSCLFSPTVKFFGIHIVLNPVNHWRS